MRLGQNLLQQGAAGGGGPLVDAVFSIDPYSGNSAANTITNGIDLAGEGGLVWIKERGRSVQHVLQDTIRGTAKFIQTNSTSAEIDSFGEFASFNSDGFSLAAPIVYTSWNLSGSAYASWTFRKAPQFFDVVTYTGTASTPVVVNHNLGSVPGLIITKQIDGNRDWIVWHRSFPTSSILLNRTNALGGNILTETPTNLDFTLATFTGANQPGNYIVYLLGHDETPEGFVRCGSYTGNGSTTGPVISLGWEPQWLLLKRTDSTGDWIIHDNARDTSNPRTAFLEPNTSDAEANGNDVDFTSSGFQLKSTSATVNASGGTYAYVAIRAEGA